MVQFDVCTTFLHGEIDEELYMIQPPYFEDNNNPQRVCKPQKSIYGLRQASRVWNHPFHQFLMKHNLQSTDADPCIYVSNKDPVILLAIFVDDGLVAAQNKSSISLILDEMNDVFQVRQNEPDTYVGLHITRNRPMRSIFLDQTQYVDCLLKRYSYTNLHPVQIPADPNLKLYIGMDHDTLENQETTFSTNSYWAVSLLLHWAYVQISHMPSAAVPDSTTATPDRTVQPSRKLCAT